MRSIVKGILFLLGAIMACDACAAIVRGFVRDTEGRPMVGIPVSDGVDVVVTGDDGSYTIETEKRNGYVFVTTPRGYMPVKMQGNRPQFWQQLTSQKKNDEVADFVLRPVADSAYVLLTLADIQLARHFGDVHHFNNTMMPDINATISSYRDKGWDVLAITLGDESFDKYWYKNGYALHESCADMEKIDCPIYNVIGNHDHDPYVAGDHKASRTWRRIMGPNYYSFNRGDVHYVILDDVYYKNDGATLGHVGHRNNEPLITPEQLVWLEKDLAQIPDKSTPIVVAMHIPLLYQAAADGKAPGYRLKNANKLMPLLSRFDNVRFFTGHTHRNQAAAAENGRIPENTYGSVCGATWSLNDQCQGTNVSLCTDGSPAGYGVWEINGRDMTGYYKSNGKDRDYQFRAYDLNTVHVPDEKYAREYSTQRDDNMILVNVFGYAPGWKVEIMENNNPLEVKQVYCQDPLYLMVNGVRQMHEGTRGYKYPKAVSHMFTAKASAPDSPITIRVTDAFGHVYTEAMSRPKAFQVNMQ